MWSKQRLAASTGWRHKDTKALNDQAEKEEMDRAIAHGATARIAPIPTAMHSHRNASQKMDYTKSASHFHDKSE